MVQALRHQPVTAESWVKSQNGQCISAEQCKTGFAPNGQCRICAEQCKTKFLLRTVSVGFVLNNVGQGLLRILRS